MNVSCPECRSIFRVDPTKVPSTMVRARCSVCGGVITISAGSSIEDEFSSNSAPVANTTRTTELEDAMAAQRANAALAAALLDTSEPTSVPKGPTPAPSAMPPLVPEPNRMPPQAPPVVERAAMPKPPLVSPQPAQPAPQPAGGRPMLFPPRPMMPGTAAGAGPAARPIVAPRTSGPTTAPAAQTNSAPPPPRTSAPNVAMPRATSAATVPPPLPTAQRPAAPGAGVPGAPTGTRTPINPFLANDPHAKAKRLARALVSDLVTYFPQKRQEGLRDGTLKQLFKDEIQKSYEEYVAQVGREFAETTPHFQDALNDLLASGQKVF